MRDKTEIAEELVANYLNKDWDAVSSLMSEEIRVRALLPNFVQEVKGRELAIGLMGSWLEPHDEVIEVESMSTASLPDSERVSVRYLARSGEAADRYSIEHHIFLRIADDQVTRFDCVCSGWQRVEG